MKQLQLGEHAGKVTRAGAAAVLLVAALTSLPGMWHLLDDLANDPDMCYVVDEIMARRGWEVLNFFSRPAPWGDGSYRPLLFLSWKLDALVFGRWAPGWGLHNLVLAVAAVAAMATLAWWSTRRAEVGIIAAALGGLRQTARLRLPASWLTAFGIVLPAGLLLTLWERRRRGTHSFHLQVWLVLIALSVAITVLHTEWINHRWVPCYVGGRTALLGGLLHFVVALAAYKYLSVGGAGWLASTLSLWAAMLLSYEQPVCLPLAAAPAFALGLPKLNLRRVIWLLGGMAALAALYAALRLHLIQVYGASDYQMMQLRGGTTWLADLAFWALPPSHLLVTVTMLEPVWLALTWKPLWVGIATACAWLVAYLPLVPRQPRIAGWYWWHIVAYVSLLRLHQHTHYSYLASLATAATHGVLLTTLADLWREKWPLAKSIGTPQATKGGPGKPPLPTHAGGKDAAEDM